MPFENPEAIPIAGDLNNGLLRVAFSVGRAPHGSVLGFEGVNFSFDEEAVQTDFVETTLDDLEVSTGTIVLTRVAVP